MVEIIEKEVRRMYGFTEEQFASFDYSYREFFTEMYFRAHGIEFKKDLKKRLKVVRAALTQKEVNDIIEREHQKKKQLISK